MPPTFHEWSASGYTRRFDDFLKRGLQPTVISASGSGSGAVFAGIWEKKSSAFQARIGMTRSAFERFNTAFRAKGLTPTSVNVYGTPGDPRYAAVWTPGAGGWSVTTGLSAARHHAEFDARVRKHERPITVAVAPDGTYTAVWTKSDGAAWYEYTGMSASGYQQRFDQMKAKGMRPAVIDTEDGVYAAVFTRA